MNSRTTDDVKVVMEPLFRPGRSAQIASRDGGRAGIAACALLVAAVACTSTAPANRPESAPQTSSRPTPVEDKGPCQPFPDRIIDEFLRAYNRRDLQALRGLVSAARIRDVVAASYAATSSFDDVAQWARAGWDVGDRFDLTGYGVPSPIGRRFSMFIERRNQTLEDEGIATVSMTFEAERRGCTIERLEMSGFAQARGEPCRFYDRFETVAEVAATAPPGCKDGSTRFGRQDPAAVWSGDEMLVWGGGRGGAFDHLDIARDGLAYEPGSEIWKRIPPAPLLEVLPTAYAWTGEELLVVGTSARRDRVLGAAFDPETRAWRRIATFPFGRRAAFTGVWTGRELLLWGGVKGRFQEDFARDVIAYDPVTDAWRRGASAPIKGRADHSAVWTETEMIVWGGSDNRTDRNNGAAYDPANDSWRKIARSPLSPRRWYPAVWTGREMIVWGGSSYSRAQKDGGAYDPATDRWRMLPPAPIERRMWHTATWTGSEVIFFGGFTGHQPLANGAAYDPVSDRWRVIPRAPLGARCHHSAVWIEAAMIVFGGYHHCGDAGHFSFGDGALYRPATDSWRRLNPAG